MTPLAVARAHDPFECPCREGHAYVVRHDALIGGIECSRCGDAFARHELQPWIQPQVLHAFRAPTKACRICKCSPGENQMRAEAAVAIGDAFAMVAQTGPHEPPTPKKLLAAIADLRERIERLEDAQSPKPTMGLGYGGLVPLR